MDALDIVTFLYLWGWGALPWGLRRKRICLQFRRPGFNPWIRTIPLKNYSILAWRIPWTEEAGGLQTMRFQKVKHDWALSHFFFFFFVSVSKEARTLKMSTGQVKYWHSPPSTILNIRLLFYLNEVDLVWTDGQLEGNHRDFPGGPVAKTPHSQYRGLGFDAWSGN